MSARRLLANLAVMALVLCLFVGAAHAIYQKTISLTGSVKLVFVAPTEPALDAEDYIKMARDAFNNSIPLYEDVRALAKNTVHPMTYGKGKGSFYDAMHTVERFFDGNANDHLKQDPVFMAQYNMVLSQLSAWYQEAAAYHDAMYQIADAMHDWNRVGKYKQAAEDAYNNYIHADSWNLDPQLYFDILRTNALSARTGYDQNVEDKSGVDAMIADLQSRLEQAWELVTALQNYSPDNGAGQLALADPFPSPDTSTLQPVSTDTQTSPDAPNPTLVPNPTLSSSPLPTPVNTPVSTDIHVPADTPAPADTLPSAVTPAPTKTPAPADTHVPTDTLPSVVTPAPTRTPALTNTPAPTKTPVPTDTPAPVDKTAPADTRIPDPTPEPTAKPRTNQGDENGNENNDAESNADVNSSMDSEESTAIAASARATESSSKSSDDSKEKATQKPEIHQEDPGEPPAL